MTLLGAVLVVGVLALAVVPPALLLSASITYADRDVLSRWLAVGGFAWIFADLVALVYGIGQSVTT